MQWNYYAIGENLIKYGKDKEKWAKNYKVGWKFVGNRWIHINW